MKSRTIVVTLALAAGLYTGAVAQDQAAPPADKADTGKMGGMMSGNMTPGMHQMMMGQNETGKLVDQIMKSFAAIEAAEKDPAALKQKLAEHGVLLRELQAKVQAQSHRMDMMPHMMGGESKK